MFHFSRRLFRCGHLLIWHRFLYTCLCVCERERVRWLCAGSAIAEKESSEVSEYLNHNPLVAKLYPCDYSCRSVKVVFFCCSHWHRRTFTKRASEWRNERVWWKARFWDGTREERRKKIVEQPTRSWPHPNRFVWRIYSGVLGLRFHTFLRAKQHPQPEQQTLNMIISKYGHRLIQFSFSTTTLVHLICEKIKRPRRRQT